MGLNRDEFAILSRLLGKALAVPEPRRSAWLDSLAEPFDGAKSALRQMLADEPTLGRTPMPKSPAAAPEIKGPGRGTRVGHYVLLREIGEGGMSTVWLARRTDALKNRPVALKLPHLHLRGARLPERFARERDILAQLAHPHIAHLYDAGVTAQGQPYLVMEYVEGESLLAFCARESLSVAARLNLFLQILDAVAHAHLKGIIHRDIKPSNILVRSGGHVVLLDFGIAKLITEGQAEVSELTVLGGPMLTLHYASPEQIAGRTLTPQTDVYSLGVVLYELLCEQRPHELSDSEAAAGRNLELAIAATDPEPPSRRISRRIGDLAAGTPDKLRRILRGDLDAIVLKSLRKSPSARYPSCEAFAADLRRHLRGEAVSARAGSGWYRARRWVRRRRAALLGAAAIAAIGVTVAVTVRIVVQRTALNSAVTADMRRSIAVLPFDDMNGDAGNDFFTQGVQDEVLTHLANISELRVMSRRATASFDNRPDRIARVSEALSVDDVLQGSVQRQHDRVLVNVQLIDAKSNTQLWAESFDRPANDIFGVERDIAESVAAHLQARLKPVERAAVAAVDTQNTEAHTADMWGRFYMAKRDEASLRKAIGYYEEAIRLDPSYAVAHADLSTAAFYMANFLDEADATPFKDQARRAAKQALALAPKLADAHAALGWLLLYFDWNVNAAEYELSQAVRLAPNSLRAKVGLANLYAVFGELDRAIAAMNEARTLDPLSAVISTSLANYFLGQERYDVAASWCHKVLEVDSSAPYCHGILAIVALAGGNPEAAEQEVLSEPQEEWKDFTLTLVRQGAEPAVANAATQAFIDRHQEHSPYLIASLYAFRNDADEAFRWLDRAYRTRDVGTIDYLQSPFFLRFRSDPRYGAFAHTLGVMR